MIRTSPSKTFNLASMLISHIFIPDKELRARFRKQMDAAGISQLSILGLVAAEAAYRDGEEWYQAVMAYIKENIEFVKEYVDQNLTNVKMIDTEGTYLIWLDFRDTKIEAEELDRRIIYDARLWLDSGKQFDDVGRGFQRINAACPRVILKEALDRLKNIINNPY